VSYTFNIDNLNVSTVLASYSLGRPT